MIIRRASTASRASGSSAVPEHSAISSGVAHLTVLDPHRGSVSVDVSGEIDLSTAAAFRDCLLAAVELPGCREVLVDLASVDFLSAAGIGVLVEAHALASEQDVAVHLVGASRIARRALVATGTDDCFDAWAAGEPDAAVPTQRSGPTP